MASFRMTAIKPIAPLSAFGTSKIGLGGGISWYSRPKSSTPSAQQMLQMALAKQTHHHSFGDRLKGIGLDVAHPFEWTMHQLLRTNTAVAEGVNKVQRQQEKDAANLTYNHHDILAGIKVGLIGGKNDIAAFIGGAKHGFQHPGSTSFSDVIKEKGLKHPSGSALYFRKHKVQAGALGLGLDVALDPLTYATFGAGATARAGEEAAHNASKVALETSNIGAKGGANVSALPDLQAASAALDAAGPRYGLAASLARKRMAAIDAISRVPHNAGAAAVDRRITPILTEVHAAERAAWAEHFNNTMRPIQIGFKMGKGSAMLNTRVPLPKVGEALVHSNVPVISKLAGAGRKAFGAGKGDWERALRVTRKHIVEERVHSYHITAKNIADQMPKLSQKEMLHAFDLYEKPGLLRKAKDGWALDGNAGQKLIRAGKLSKKQYHFLVKWDQWANTMLDMDKMAGVKVDHVAERTGGGYVPHIFEGDKTMSHVPNDKIRQFLKRAGYTRMRKTDMTLKRLVELHGMGKFEDKLQTDPFKMMVAMSRAHANAQADQAIFHVLTDAFGVPARVSKMVPQTEKLQEAQQKLAAVQKKIHDMTLGPIEAHPKGAKNATLIEKTSMDQNRIKRLIALEKKWSDRVEAYKKPVQKMVKNPDVHDQMVTFKGIDGRILRNAQGEKIKIEPEGADAFRRYETILRDPKERLQLNSAWQQAMAKWKLAVTAVNIGGYRIRNTMSDFWNMYLNGVPIREMPRAAGMATHFMVRVKKGDPAALAEFLHLYHSGALSGVFGGDVAILAKELETGRGTALDAARRGRLIKAASRTAQTANRNAENWGRLTHYMYRTRIEGMSSSRALQHVREAHFDYEDLTPTEQAIKSKFIPFYTWTRKDVPYQIKQLVEHPGRYSLFPKAVLESENAAGTKGDIPPSYLDSSLSFKVPGLGYLTPQIGVSDVARFQNPKLAAGNLANMGNPVFKAAAELMLNKQFYSGQPIKDPSGHARNPVSNWLAPILGMVPGTDVGTTSRIVKGKRVFGPGANPYALYFTNQLPLTRYLGTSFNPITRQKRGAGPELSYWLGLSTTQVDKQAAVTAEQLALQDKVKAEIKKLRDAGLYPQSNRKMSKNEQKILAQIAANLRRR